MKLKELFNQCNETDIYLFLKKHRRIPHLTKSEFNKRLSTFTNIDSTPCRKEYHLMYMPYSSANTHPSDKELFLIKNFDNLSDVHDCDLFSQTVLLPHINCEDVSYDILMNASICPLSLINFSPVEICAEVFYSVLISPEDIVENMNCDVARIFDVLNSELSGETCFYKKVSTPDIDALVKEYNTVCQPYYSSIEK